MTNTQTDLVKALTFANTYHAEQKDLSGDPYILHLTRVMHYAAELTGNRQDYDVLITALLHDIVEDTSFTHEQVEQYFGPVVALAVKYLTRGEEPYMEYIEALKVNDLAVIVKCADLMDNSDPDRACEGFDSLCARYTAAYSALREDLERVTGNSNCVVQKVDALINPEVVCQ